MCDHVVNDRIQDMVDVRFQFYKLLDDAPDVRRVFPGDDVRAISEYAPSVVVKA